MQSAIAFISSFGPFRLDCFDTQTKDFSDIVMNSTKNDSES